MNDNHPSPVIPGIASIGILFIVMVIAAATGSTFENTTNYISKQVSNPAMNTNSSGNTNVANYPSNISPASNLPAANAARDAANAPAANAANMNRTASNAAANAISEFIPNGEIICPCADDGKINEMRGTPDDSTTVFSRSNPNYPYEGEKVFINEYSLRQGWYQVRFKNGLQFWIHGNNLKFVNPPK